jgi:hypothetical protein
MARKGGCREINGAGGGEQEDKWRRGGAWRSMAPTCPGVTLASCASFGSAGADLPRARDADAFLAGVSNGACVAVTARLPACQGGIKAPACNPGWKAFNQPRSNCTMQDNTAAPGQQLQCHCNGNCQRIITHTNDVYKVKHGQGLDMRVLEVQHRHLTANTMCMDGAQHAPVLVCHWQYSRCGCSDHHDLQQTQAWFPVLRVGAGHHTTSTCISAGDKLVTPSSLPAITRC